MNETSHHGGGHVDSLTGAYALDALEELDRARMERHLAECEDCAAEVRSFRETAAVLAAATAAQPPPGIRSRVLNEVHRTQQLPPATAAPTRASAPRPARWLAVAAAALLVASGGLGTVAWRTSQDAERARQFAAAVSEVLTDPQRQVVDTEFADGHGTVMVAGDRVVVVGEGVSAPPAGRAFQMWFIGQEGPRPSQILQPIGDDAFCVHAQGIQPGDAVGVTVEPEGGSQQPTSDPVLLAQPAEA